MPLPSSTNQNSSHYKIAIVGSGFGGLGMAIGLKKAGLQDFVIFERADDVGGVWRDNSYPGCACDVESPLYSFSFELNPQWRHKYSAGPDIWEYLRQCTQKYDLLPHLRFKHEVTEARWDSDHQCWRIKTSAGDFSADFLIIGTGALSEPSTPKLKGLDSFKGALFHSARWRHDFSLLQKNIVVIGTGASAIQFVPAIAAQVKNLFLFQRTPPWILPRADRPIRPWERQLLSRFPWLMKLWRARLSIAREIFGLAFRHKKLMALGKIAAKWHLAKAIKDPLLRQKLTPRYEMGCKRILISDDYYPALARANVHLVTEGLGEIRAHSVTDQAGREYPADAIILGTGFQVTDLPCGSYIFGREGKTLKESLGPSPKAYLGTTFAGFPNLFMIQGPNTGLGHSSVVQIIEAQIEHILKALNHVQKNNLSTLEPRPEALARYNQQIDQLMKGTVWTSGGCQSWYLDSTGRNSTLWPRSVPSLVQRLHDFHPTDFL